MRKIYLINVHKISLFYVCVYRKKKIPLEILMIEIIHFSMTRNYNVRKYCLYIYIFTYYT